MNIPEKYQEFCREVGKLAKQYELNRVTIRIQPSFLSDWQGEINATWEDGRHGEDAEQIYIESTVRVHTTLTPPKPDYHPNLDEPAEPVGLAMDANGNITPPKHEWPEIGRAAPTKGKDLDPRSIATPPKP